MNEVWCPVDEMWLMPHELEEHFCLEPDTHEPGSSWEALEVGEMNEMLEGTP